MDTRKPNSFNSRLDEGLDNIEVVLWDHPDAQAEAEKVASFFVSTWGDPRHDWHFEDEPWAKAQFVADGKGLPNALESVVLTFSINGVSRATTHQLVRSRVGVGFGQQGGRDNDWSNFNLRQPTTYMNFDEHQWSAISEAIEFLNSMYTEALSRGIPYQDARYILPMGLETHLVGSYNLLALMGTLKRRLCNRMMWETNYVARLMADLTVTALPWVGRNLQAGCRRGICQSVSPMFPPADLVPYAGSPDARLASDNPTLQQEMDGADYDWPRESNGCYLHFDSIDRRRITNEYNNRDTVFSLVDGETPLAYKVSGIWRPV